MLRILAAAVLGGVAGMFALMLFLPTSMFPIVIELPALSLTEQVTLLIGVLAGVAAFTAAAS